MLECVGVFFSVPLLCALLLELLRGGGRHVAVSQCEYVCVYVCVPGTMAVLIRRQVRVSARPTVGKSEERRKKTRGKGASM